MCHGGVEVVGEPVALGVDNALLQNAFKGPVAAVFFHRINRLHIFKEAQQNIECIFTLNLFVVDERTAYFLLLFRNTRERQDFAGMNNCRVETNGRTFGKKDAVQYLAQRWLQTKAHIRQAKCGESARNFFFNAANGFHCCQAVATQIFVAGTNREGERVEDEIG